MKAQRRPASVKTRRGGKVRRSKRAGGKEAVRRPSGPPNAAQLLTVLALLLALVASGLSVVRRAEDARQLHQDLEAARKGQDQLLVEHSRLLLERAALSAYYNVERAAVAELGMRFPDQVEQLAP